MSTLSVRRPLSVLAVLAMVATLMFAVVGTASAAATPANPATFSACPDNAGIPDGGFTDVPPASFFDDAVNCLKYYTVTTGVTPTTYEPATDVTRVQMALFLARSAAAAGVVLSASPPSAGFTDISGLSAEAQLAINQLADAGIVKGKTATTYGPAQTVWRQQMALFLTRFLGKAVVGPGGTALAGAATSGSPFTDLGNTTVEANKAINQAWDIGVATGDTATTYDPLGNVNRGQMALFLTRLYGHTNTRPGGVNIQAKPVTGFGAFASMVSVTARTTGFLPSAGSNVDVWRFDPSSTVATPFLTNGTCNTASLLITQLQGGGTPCTLEAIDPVTDPNGNWPVFSENAIDGKTSTFYAWTAALGTQFVNGVTSNYSMVTINSSKGATNATLKVNLPKYAENPLASNSWDVKYPGSVTWTVQLTDGPTATAKPVAKAGVSYQFDVSRQVIGGVVTVNSTTVKTDASGKATYTATETDPSALPGDWTWVSVNVINLGTAPAAVPGGNIVWWGDVPAAANTLVAATATKWKVQSNGAGNTATATVYDQYGKTMSGVPVTFGAIDDAVDASGIPLVPSHSTASNGVATYGYVWTYTAPGLDVTALETITPFVTATPAVNDFVNFYWVNAAADGFNAPGATPVLVADTANDAVVGLVGDYTVWTWAATDQFWQNAGVDTATQKEFETQVALLGGLFQVQNYLGTTAGVSTFTSGP